MLTPGSKKRRNMLEGENSGNKRNKKSQARDYKVSTDRLMYLPKAENTGWGKIMQSSQCPTGKSGLLYR
jgi:hypothetical protein